MLAAASPVRFVVALKNGLSDGCCAVVVEPQDDPGQVRIVRFRSAKLIVGNWTTSW